MKYLKQFSSVEDYNNEFETEIKEKYSNVSLIKENEEFFVKSYEYHQNFIANKYLGVIDKNINEDNITSELILNLDSVIKLPGYKYKTETLYSSGIKKLLYAYPYEDKLESIKDQNEIEYLLLDNDGNPSTESSFSTGTVFIGEINYRWYLLREPANLDDLIFEFL